MSSSPNTRLESLFSETMALPAAEREAFLRERCGTDSVLLAQLLRLVAADDATGALCGLTELARASAAALEERLDLAPREGEWIGSYHLIRSVGAGTYGEVFLAEQTVPIRRKVAVKVLHARWSSTALVGRFRVEQQSLARMDHPNIAKVYDAGASERGLPYFVMQYIQGEPITAYCDRRRLTVEERLALFRTVCEAVEHAHIKSVVHRDLKPSNVLVMSAEGGGPEPMVIDFGVAKVMEGGERDASQYGMDQGTGAATQQQTERGRAVGTWAYMSPEQASGEHDVDTRSDVYSLGVLLYELLCGARPFADKTLSVSSDGERRRLIREGEPPSPSSRLRSDGTAGEVATARRTNAAELTRRLRRELEWIPLKAMEKRPDRRYQRAAELSDDVERYLRGFPLHAGPGSKLYRMRALFRRRKAAVAAGLAIGLVAAIGFAGTVLYAVEAGAQAKAAKLATDRAESESARATETAQLAEDRRKIADENATQARLARARSEREAIVANLNAADASLSAGDVARAKRRLAAIPLGARGWEHQWLSSRADMSELRIDAKSSGTISASRNGSIAATCSEDNTVRVWNLETGELLHQLSGHRGKVMNVSVSPDGARIATSDSRGDGRLWDAATGAQIASLAAASSSESETAVDQGTTFALRVEVGSGSGGATTPVTSIVGNAEVDTKVIFSPDGTYVVTTAHDHVVRVWDGRSGQLLLFLEGHRGRLGTPSFSRDGSRLVTPSWDSTARVWDVASGGLVATLVGHSTFLTDAAINHNGTRALTTCADGTARLWDVATARVIRDIRGGGLVRLGPCGFMTNSDAFYIASTDSLRVYDERTLEPTAEFPSVGSTAVTVSVDDTRALLGASDGSIDVWSLSTKSLLMKLRGHDRAVRGIGVDGDSRRAVSSSLDGSVRRWGIGSVRTQRWRPGSYLSTATPLSDGRALLNSSDSPQAIIWDVEGGCISARIGTGSAPLQAVAASASGSHVVLARQKGGVELWDLKNKKVVWSVSVSDQNLTSVAVSADATRVVVGDGGGVVRLLDGADGGELLQRTFPSRYVFAVACDPRKNDIAVAVGRSIVVLSGEDGTETVRIEGHGDDVRSVRYSHDGQRLLTASRDHTARMWTRGGEALLTLSGHDAVVHDARWNLDESRVLTCSADATVRLWDGTSGDELLVLRGATNGFNAAFFQPGTLRIVGCSSADLHVWDASPFTDLALDPARTDEGRAVLAEARGLRGAGRLNDAIAKYRDAVNRLRGRPAARADLAGALSDLGYILGTMAAPIREEADSILAEAAAEWAALGSTKRRERFGTLHNRADVLVRLGQPTKAEGVFEEALRGKRDAFGEDDDDVRITQVRWASVAIANGKLDAARVEIDLILARDANQVRRHRPYLRQAMTLLSRQLEELGDRERVERSRTFVAGLQGE